MYQVKTQLLNKGFKSDKIKFCSNGVDINKFKPLTNKHKFINEYQLKNKTIGFVGTFGPWHGIDLCVIQLKSLIKIVLVRK